MRADAAAWRACCVPGEASHAIARYIEALEGWAAVLDPKDAMSVRVAHAAYDLVGYCDEQAGRGILEAVVDAFEAVPT